MSKKITNNQLLGEIGETAVRLRFLRMGFQFDARSRLEAGIDGIAEVMDSGRPMARMIAVQVKTTDAGRYVEEDDGGFTYLLKSEDLTYWRGSNLPIIIVLYRESDDSCYWQDVRGGVGEGERRLRFSKIEDVLDKPAADRLATLTVPKAGLGYYVPPLGGGEEALVNMLPVVLPEEIFVATTPHIAAKAVSVLLDLDEPARFDWIIKGGTFWSFRDPRQSVCREIVDVDQVEAIDTASLAFHDDEDERNSFAFLLRRALGHQVRAELAWSKDRRLFYFRARAENQSRKFAYEASKRKAEAEVVNVAYSKTDSSRVDFVRHHAFIPRFESLYDQWFLVINPTYYFTTNGFIPHSHPAALLAGKKRLDNSASLRGQVVMWHRLLTKSDRDADDLFATPSDEPQLRFDAPPSVSLPMRVPDDVWGTPKKLVEDETDQKVLSFDEV